MRVSRYFTQSDPDAYAGIAFRSHQCSRPDGRGGSVSLQVQVPAHWSQMASDILVQKYFRSAGIPARLRVDPSEEHTNVPVWLRRQSADLDALNQLPPEQRLVGETDARQVFDRLAGAWTWWGWRGGYFSSEPDARAFFDELRRMLCQQIAAPNSPQWFNTGLYWAYGICGPAQGHWFIDPQTDQLCATDSAYERPQPHACFIQSLKDDLVGPSGIMDLWLREARLFKYGSGTGTNFSGLRAEGELLTGGGCSSGLMSFLKIGDRSAGAIKSGGTTRRAAKMVILDVDHPDIEDFINWKVIEEQKVAALVVGSHVLAGHNYRLGQLSPNDREQRQALIRQQLVLGVPPNILARDADSQPQSQMPIYTTDWNSEAYTTVAGQNSNNSVRVTDNFLGAVEEDQPWQLIWRTTGQVARTMPARHLWEQIAAAAWACADPGLQYDTTINDWHTCPAGGRINASNPCSEYMFLDDTACNLASLNLLRFYQADGSFDLEGYQHTCRLWTLVLEISVLMAQYPSPEIARRSYDYRPLGLGYTNLGGLLMRRALPYDDPQGRSVAAALTALMTAVVYATSAEIAAELGPFKEFAANRESMLRVMANHRRAASGGVLAEDSTLTNGSRQAKGYENLSISPVPLLADQCPLPGLVETARQAWDRAFELGKRHGYRNAQATAIAPTGTISLVMDCDTTGIEPDYALVKFKQLAGGGSYKIINKGVPEALQRLGYPQGGIL